MVNMRRRVIAAALVMSLGGIATWKHQEGFEPEAMIPTKGDVPTIGYGSTQYEDGTPVKLGDKITRQRADQLAKGLIKKDEQVFIASVPGVELYQEEFDLYVNYMGQFGQGNWRKSTMRRELLAGNHVGACKALLRYRYAAGYDCSTRINGKPNKRCWGVWTRQLERHKQCMAVQ